MIASLLVVLTLQIPAAPAESALAAGDIRKALQLAEQAVRERPRDPAAHMLLGRVHYARPVIGRFPALAEFRTAATLAPNDPEPWYWQMKVGFYLRSDDGDYIARQGLLGLFAATPDYKDAWQRFHDIYQAPRIWRQAERALARHGEVPVALERRAELLIALEDGVRAESLLAIVAAGGGATARTDVLRSEAAFLAGRVSAGYAWHDSALARANIDSTDALWDEAWLIASPAEVAQHNELRPDERRAFYERFWQRRDPDLLTPENERVAEHYARRAEVRRTYRLLHPQRSSYRSPLARAVKQFDDRQTLRALAGAGAIASPSSDPFWALTRAATVPFEALQDSMLPLAARAQTTAQGLVYLRQGAPDRQMACVTDLRRASETIPNCTGFLDGETWMYYTAAGPQSVFFIGGEYALPVSGEQLQSTKTLLQTDRSTLPAPLVARAWSAAFRSAESGMTDVYYKARGDSAAVALWDDDGGAHRATGEGLLRITTAPGHYQFGLDVDSAGVLGRTRRSITVRAFSPSGLSLSSLALMPFERGERLPDRESALRGMPADLTYPAATPLAAYVEIYGLAAGQDARSEYRVRYTFEPARSALAKFLLGAARPVVFEFDRAAIDSTAIEQLIIEPDKLPPGRYRVTVAVTDLARNVKTQSVAIEIDIR